MQNWKIKRMSDKKINQWLKATNEMILNYKGKIKFSKCPFCIIAKKICGDCIWKIIEGKICGELCHELYPHRHFTPATPRNDLRFKKWRATRLIQLKSWKKILKIELARREL